MSYRKLEIWQIARDVSIRIHRMTLESLPALERFEEGSQIRRSAKSIRSNRRRVNSEMSEPGCRLRDTGWGYVDRGEDCFISPLVSRISHLVSRILPIALLFLSPAVAFAHTRGGEAAGFLAGLSHPVSGLDHILAMIAVGLWGAQLGPPAVWLLPVTFPMVMAFGGTLGLAGVKLPGIEVGIALSAIGLGAAVLFESRPKLWIAATLVGFFAIFHGHAHGTELPPGANGMLYSIGFVIATGLLHATGIGIGLIHRWPLGRTALRIAGAVVALGGLAFLWRAVN